MSLSRLVEMIESAFSASFEDPASFEPSFLFSAYSKSDIPVITSLEPDKIVLKQWGLIPYWAKDMESARKIQSGTANARAETLFEKPSFKKAIIQRRCLVIADGFYEWQDRDGKKYPWYIHLKNRDLFTIAGIWDNWTDPVMKKTYSTVSVITTRANPLMEKVHNTKMRMPVILHEEDQMYWLNPEMNMTQILSLCQPYPEEEMTAYEINNYLLRKTKTDDPDMIKPIGREKELF